MISVPLLDNPSRHSDPNKSESFLVLFENSKGEIRRGDIAILNDTENSIDSLSMYDLYSDNPLSTKRYSVKLVNLQDFKFVDKTMFEENLETYSFTYSEYKEGCTHWWIRTSTYYLGTGEIIDIDYEYLGCFPNSNCPPNSLCDDYGGGGGVGGNIVEEVSVY